METLSPTLVYDGLVLGDNRLPLATRRSVIGRHHDACALPPQSRVEVAKLCQKVDLEGNMTALRVRHHVELRRPLRVGAQEKPSVQFPA